MRALRALTLVSAWALLAPAARAGLNSAAVAHIYWQSGSTGSALAARDNSNGMCQFVVTSKGLANFAGADVQILLCAADDGALPAAWQGQAGGCAEGFIGSGATSVGLVGGRGGSLLPNAFTTAPAVPGVLASQNSEFYNTGDCKTPHNVALLWLSCAGGAGVARSSTVEYALWAVACDLANSVNPADGTTPCGGGSADPAGPHGICLIPKFFVPCSDPARGAALALLDGNLDVDFAGFAPASYYLSWSLMVATNCFPHSVAPTTWSRIKRTYR